MIIAGNLVQLARGVVPQHQEYLHDAIVSASSSVHIPYSSVGTDYRLDHPRDACHCLI